MGAPTSEIETTERERNLAEEITDCIVSCSLTPDEQEVYVASMLATYRHELLNDRG